MNTTNQNTHIEDINKAIQDANKNIQAWDEQIRVLESKDTVDTYNVTKFKDGITRLQASIQKLEKQKAALTQ